MRLKQSVIAAVVFSAIVIVTAPIWSLIWVSGLTIDWLREHKRKIFGPRVGEWQPWFAWHPVCLDLGNGDLIWLETVSRQALGSSYNFGIAYIRPGKAETEAP